MTPESGAPGGGGGRGGEGMESGSGVRLRFFENFDYFGTKVLFSAVSDV